MVSNSDKPNSEASQTYAIETENLTMKFGERTSVSNLNLEIRSGELYALLGDNGAGKTTTINMLTSLLRPSSGRYLICGVDGVKNPEKVKGLFGIVSQDVSLYDELTAAENLHFIADLYGIPAKKSATRISELLERAGLEHRAGDRVGEFSGGMKRKLAIASAFLHEPRVLFMDEPTVGLDPVARRQIWQTLTELKQLGVTILLTTHYLEEAELLADRIGIIRQGELVVEGTIDELRVKIQGMRAIQVRLINRLSSQELETKLAELRSRFGTSVEYDALRGTILMGQPADRELTEVLSEFIQWVESSGITFSRIATSEPNLEEVFVAITADEPASTSDGIGGARSVSSPSIDNEVEEL